MATPDTIPNLAKVATADLVENIGTGNFKASYINWARTVQLLREHAPGWEPEIVPNANGEVLHRAPVGAFMMLRFRKGEQVTQAIPQAVMDNRNAAIKFEAITARDITDTHRRGICLAAAMTFGLAYELWAKMPLEKGFSEADGEGQGQSQTGAVSPAPKRGLDGPHTSKAALYKAFTALQTDVARCGDDDELTALLATADAKVTIAQCERDAPHYLHGGDDAPPDFEPLYARIKRMRDEFQLENVA